MKTANELMNNLVDTNMNKHLKELRDAGYDNWYKWSLDKTDRSLYRFTTIIICAYKINLDTRIDSIITEIRNDISNFKRRFSLLTSSCIDYTGGIITFKGAFELELLNPMNSAYRYKRDTIYGVSDRTIDIDLLDDSDRVIVLHIHMLMYGNALGDLHEIFDSVFKIKRQVVCKILDNDRQTLEQAVEAITEYCWKFRFDYAITDSYLRTKFIGSIEPEYKGMLCDIYKKINMTYDL